MEKFCISVDWLQVCCYCNVINEGQYNGSVCKYDVTLSDTETAMFKQLFYIKNNGLPIATIQASPRPGTLNTALCLLKIENRILYSNKYIAILYDIMNCLKMTYKGITRLDLCYDCNYFHNHRSPAKFVHNFIFKKEGENGFIYRKGSESFTCHGSKTPTSASKITSISYGSNNNKVRQYMYDKSIELQEVKDKPWIREYWELNGLENTEKTHVWRTEISIKSQGMDILNMSTGELFKLSPVYLEHIEKIQKMFFFYADKYLRFHICEGQIKTRNYPRLQLFEYDSDIVTCKPVNINLHHDTGRSEKICLNKLIKLQEQYVDLSEQNRHGLYTATLFLQTLSNLKAERNRITKADETFSGLMANRFIDLETQAYFEALEKAHEHSRDISVNGLYDAYLSSLVN